MAQPPFTEPELVLMLAFYLDRREGGPAEIEALCATLKSLDLHTDRGDPEIFRTADGVMRAIRRFDVYAEGRSDRDSPAYRAVWDRYADDRPALTDMADRILVEHGPRTGGSPTVRAWWRDDLNERFWLEASHRPDRGTDLRAPAANKDGRPYWSYELVREVEAGDVVFHYDADAMAITHWSLATGDRWVQDAWWSALGTASRGTPQSLQPHWFCGLHGPFRVTPRLERADLVAQARASETIRAGLKARVGASPYFPFQHRADGLRISQGYLFKVPAELVALFEPLRDAAVRAEAMPTEVRRRTRRQHRLASLPPPGRASVPSQVIGQAYTAADEGATVAESDPFPADPAVVERSLRSHARLQNRLAAEVVAAGLEPLEPNAGNPLFDLAWRSGDELYVAEVKSLTRSNEERQLRLGLGQLLRYRHQLSAAGTTVHAVLYVERRPSDATWHELCASLGVDLRAPA